MKLKSFIFLIICFLTIRSITCQTNPDTTQKIIKQDLTTIASQDDGFKDALTTTLQNFDSAKIFHEMMAATNRLGLIARKWDNQWAAQYYAAYSLVILSYAEKEQKNKDPYLDEAENFLNTAWALTKSDSSEMYVLAAMHANARMAVIPASRYKKFGDLFNSNIEKAKKLWPENPRIYYLLGMNFFYTPKMFGGGPKNAMPYIEKAESYYTNEKTNNILKPHWGRKQNSEMLAKCKEEVK
jgi:hypothetical protein